MLRKLSIAGAMLLSFTSPLVADEPGNPIKPRYSISQEQWPVLCSDDPEVIQRQLDMGFLPMWQGITNEQVLSTLMVHPNGTWMFDLSFAGTEITCILVDGQDNGLVGDEANAS